MTFQLPDELPITTDELSDLREKATAEITEIQKRYEGGEELADTDVESLNSLLDAVDKLNSAITDAAAEAEAHKAAVADAIERSKVATVEPVPSSGPPPVAPHPLGGPCRDPREGHL